VTTVQDSWTTSFEVDGVAGGPIRLHQINRRDFELHSTLHYLGDTGLDGFLDEDTIERVRTITPAELPATDLVSVPGLFRWFTGPYGSHTPAALIHDRFIGSDHGVPGFTDQLVDRYFRFMLHATGVRWVKRWIMWAAVAARSRYHADGWTSWKRLTLVGWSVLSLVGTVVLLWSLLTQRWGWTVVALVAPLPASLLWGRQAGAGLITAYSSPWLVPPTLLAGISYGVYAAAEWVIGLFQSEDTAGTEDIHYPGF